MHAGLKSVSPTSYSSYTIVCKLLKIREPIQQCTEIKIDELEVEVGPSTFHFMPHSIASSQNNGDGKNLIEISVQAVINANRLSAVEIKLYKTING